MDTRIENLPRFWIPDQVIYRATEANQPKKNLRQIEQLLLALKAEAEVPSAVRFWVDQWLARSEAQRYLGKAQD